MLLYFSCWGKTIWLQMLNNVRMSISSTTSRKSLSLNTGSEILISDRVLVMVFFGNSNTAVVIVAALTVSIVLEKSWALSSLSLSASIWLLQMLTCCWHVAVKVDLLCKRGFYCTWSTSLSLKKFSFLKFLTQFEGLRTEEVTDLPGRDRSI